MNRFATTLLVIASIAISASAAAQLPRDRQVTATSGRARIAGVVTSADREATPLRRARVTVTGGNLILPRAAITADDGSFTIDALAAGAYSVAASKSGYAAMNYGATRSGRPGARIVVKDGETHSIALRLPRGAVIAGMITTPDGEPVQGMPVAAMSHRYFGPLGTRRLLAAGSTVTDDRGMYRIYGLPAGDYAIMANPEARPLQTPVNLQPVSEADVRRALSEVRDTRPASRPGLPAAPPPAARADTPRRVTLAPVYFPGTGIAARATLIKVAAGEERATADFSIDYVAVARIEGFVAGVAAGVPVVLTSADTSLTTEGSRGAAVTPDGRFTFENVTPGTYVAHVRSRGTPGSEPLVGSTLVVVNGDDVGGVAITTTKGLTVAGRIAFDGAPPSIDFSGLKVTLPPAISPWGTVNALPPIQLQADGRFVLAGVPPGPYRFSQNIQGVRAPIGTWWLKSFTMAGREALDAPLQFDQNVDDAVLTFSTSASTLSGTVGGLEGSAPPAYIVVFSTNRDSWFVGSRRVTAVKPGDDGRYSVRNLPPGDYFVTATDDLENLEWFDPQVLQQLAAGAKRVTLSGVESKTLDVVWSRPDLQAGRQ